MDNEDSGSASLYDGAVNSLILDYYKKFGRKRDLEQYFSLSTAQSDIKDPSSSFWQKMKSENDSSDSGGKKSESSTELCRISIKCSLPDPSSSQDENTKTKSDTESQITEENDPDTSKHSDNESVKSDDYHSQKSVDITLDTSMNKPFSPTSSINSQRKLEWDSLADVGYANESDRKTSGSSLSTLERLALKQQYSNNDSKNDDLGAPKAHSTFLDSKDSKYKSKKGLMKKTTKIHQRDFDVVELNMPRTSENQAQAINFNLTKHISFNVEKDGAVSVDRLKQDVKVTTEKVEVDTVLTPQLKNDKEIQTSLRKVIDRSSSMDVSKEPERREPVKQGIPVLITFNTLKRRRKKKLNIVRKKHKSKKRITHNHKSKAKEKSAGQVSEAESFEYMPGHIYNQNQIKDGKANVADNKSSLESSGVHTTDSSKGSKHSFTNDLEKSINFLKVALHKKNNDSELKKKLIKEVVHRLLQTRYRDDGSSTEFLSGLSFSNEKFGQRDVNYTTTSTSDANNTGEKVKPARPKKSILRSDKFNANALASTSQSAPNLPSVSNCDKPVSSNLRKHIEPAYTESDNSSKEKTSSDTAFARTSSEELYQKYLEALGRENTYKKHLKYKELFLKHKLVSSDTAFKVPVPIKTETNVNKRLQELMKDLTRNNYDDGSGDASKLEGGSTSNVNSSNNVAIKKQRSHSVFTLSSGNSEGQNKKTSLRNQLLKEMKGTGSVCKEDHQCVCPYHSNNAKICVADSSCQVNIECQCKRGQGSKRNSPREVACVLPGSMGENLKYVCLCSDKVPEDAPENFLMYKCSRLIHTAVQFEGAQISPCNNIKCISTNTSPKETLSTNPQPSTSKDKVICSESIPVSRKSSKCSQTSMNLDLNLPRTSCRSTPASSRGKQSCESTPRKMSHKNYPATFDKSEKKMVNESTRWMQTEISINPRISDPVLSDVKFVNDCECAKLIDQRCREVTKSCSNTCFKTVDDKSEGRPQLNSDEFEKHGEDVKEHSSVKIKDLGQNLDVTASCNIRERNTDNFKIPIQGTNMTLMVSIGANTITAPIQTTCIDSVNTGIVTENIPLAEKGTCLAEDCSKSVQCQNTNIFEQIYMNKPCHCDDDIGSDKIISNPSDSSIDAPFFSNKPILVNNLGVGDVKSSTYPKSVQISERKPFLRSNTDTGNFRYDKMQGEFKIRNRIDDKISRVTKDMPKVTKESSCGTDVEHRSYGSEKSTTSRCSSGRKRDMGTQRYLNESPSSPRSSPTRIESTKSSPKQHQSRKCYEENNERSKDVDMGSLQNKSKKSSPEQTPDRFRNTIENNKFPTSSQCKSKKIAGPSKDFKCSEVTQKSDSGAESRSSPQPPCGCKINDQNTSQDVIIDMIKSITERYSKKNAEKLEKKKCFKEIFTVLNYLLDTEDSTDSEQKDKEICGGRYKETKKVQSRGSSPKGFETAGDDSRSSDCQRTKMSSSKKLQEENSKCISCQSKKKTRTASNSPVNKIQEQNRIRHASPTIVPKRRGKTDYSKYIPTRDSENKSVQCCSKRFNKFSSNTESSDVAISTEPISTSTDTATSKVVNKIRKECEKYHQKRTSSKCEKSCGSDRNHYCSCRNHKCKSHRPRTTDKPKNKCLAYNLIIQPSDSMLFDDTVERKSNPLKNIVLKVPTKSKPSGRVPFQEVSAKIEKDMPCFAADTRSYRSRSVPNESEFSTTAEDVNKIPTAYTVREYLEKNRPDFVENCNQRQNCLKLVSDCRANERAVKRELLSVQLQHSPLKAISENDLCQFARQIGIDLRRRKEPAKFISEREMKKHSEKIYKSLPEVVRKKEEARKENVKKTNLLMASLFKKNLLKKTLRGTVNLSNYSPIIKI